jgi:general secretion pathway protein A
VIARFHLDALTPAETAQYIRHRLEVAGLTRPLPFERSALQRVHQLARGVPRRVNLLCDRALLGAFASGLPMVDKVTVSKAALEVFGPAPAPTGRWRRSVSMLGLGLAGAALFAMTSRLLEHDSAPAIAAPPVAVRPAPAAAALTGASAATQVATVQNVGEPALPPRLLRDSDQAWRELAGAWQAEVGAGDPCKALLKERLQCFSSKNLSLALIRELERPGILTLDAATGKPSYAVLTGLTRETATLRAAGTEQKVTLAALAARWQGGFATLWQAPPGYTGRVGTDGETVDWMAERLAAVNGLPAPQGPRSLDAPLKSQLRAFQLAKGLVADGQPGPLTLMQLNRVAGVNEPRLRTGP